MNQKRLSGSNINKVKEHNLQAILFGLLNEPGLSRVQLARMTNLSNTTITNLVAQLMEQGIIVEDCDSESASLDVRPVGRPRTGVCLQPNARFVIGVHIGIGTFRLAITNLENEPLVSQIETFEPALDAESVVTAIVNHIEALIDESGVTREKIIGVGIGASGLVDFQAGINLLSTKLNWRNVPLRDLFQQKLNLPVVVDNNVRAMAIGETYFGAGRNSNSLVFVYGRVGVGAGLTFKGEVYRGNAMGAGEIGHTIMLMQGGQPCHCGNQGCLETLISENVILNDAAEIARENPSGLLASYLNQQSDLSIIERIFQAGRDGDEQVCAMLSERAGYLGMALVNVVNLFNPEVILLGGIFSQGQDFFVEPAAQMVRKLSFGGMGQKVRIEATGFGWKAGVLGASALALINFFYQPETL
ncbi:MAG: ROK family transcriptional regulator [Anaerolineales bacterium]